MRKKTRNLIIGIIAFTVLILIFGKFFNLFSLFSPNQELRIIQYDFYSGDTQGVATSYFLGAVAESIPTDRNMYQYSSISNDPSIRFGQNIYEFKSQTSDNGQSCTEQISVLKNGQLVNTINAERSSTYNISDENGYIILDMNQALFSLQYGTPLCKGWFNTFELHPSQNSITFNASIPSSFSGSLPINVEINNHFSTILKGDLSVNLEILTAIGTFKQDLTQTINLNSGKNNLTINVPINGTIDQLIITPKIDISVPGTSFTNLNFNRDTNPISGCYQVYNGWTCGNPPHFSPISSKAQVTIQPTDFIDIGTIQGDQIIVKNNQVVQTIPSNNQSTTTNTTSNPPGTNQTPNQNNLLYYIIGIILAVAVLGFIYFKKKR